MEVHGKLYSHISTRQSSWEEIANTVTHGVGLALSIVAAAGLIAHARNHVSTSQVIVCGVYVLTLVTLYGASTLSHAIRSPRPKFLLRSLDQGAIYLLIAGSYTPFVFAFHDALWSGVVLASLWSLALCGFLSKVVFRHRIEAVALGTYVLLGLLPATTLLHLAPWGCLAWAGVGGLSYTIGMFFLTLDQRFPYFHAAWHLLVIGGTACHYFAILQYTVS